MIELELKARVDDIRVLSERLSSFARRGVHVIRSDDYWGRSADDTHKIRIRRESFLSADGSLEKTDILVTYKHKSKIKGADGIEAEANDEKECVVSDAAALESFLQDTGCSIQLKKKKDVEDWTVELPPETASFAWSRADCLSPPAACEASADCGVPAPVCEAPASGQEGVAAGAVAVPRLFATLEVCQVERLGDFIEIEILSPSDDGEVLSVLHGELEKLLEKSGISKDKIERRYYSEMLRELDGDGR